MHVIFLLSLPVGLMGLIHVFFGILALLVFQDGVHQEFLDSGLILVGVSLFCAIAGIKRDLSKVNPKQALLFAVSTWLVMGLLGAVPIFSITDSSIADSVFESISGLTTTGATVLSGLDELPKSFLLYRQFLQWLGGLGIVIFVVAVLPILNVGGMKLLRAETPGPIKDQSLSPRISKTAHYLWLVYVLLTAACALSYLAAGMSVFDAFAHSFSTLSTGGFSTHDASMGYFNSPLILNIANVFMLMGAINFALHFQVWRGRRFADLKIYWRDEELRTFISLVLVFTLVIALMLYLTAQIPDFTTALNQAAFHLISFMTSTGYGAGDYTGWSYDIVILLIFASYLGGCAGSTAGGNKIIRNLLTAKLVYREIKRLIHPKAEFTVRYQGEPIEISVVDATLAFMTVAATTSMILTLVLMMTGLDFWSAFTAVVACINVLGPGFGEVGSNYQPLSDTGAWILSFAMLLGRLEYFTILALLLPGYWRRF